MRRTSGVTFSLAALVVPIGCEFQPNPGSMEQFEYQGFQYHESSQVPESSFKFDYLICRSEAVEARLWPPDRQAIFEGCMAENGWYVRE